ncbi:MAG: 3-hydroxybutyryl-CoA dehydrogenase, partial [Bdellovibrionales bacterium]|nr:3-hydroxybutyryl-CoA dehydrogenase [Bdellovibrionales bacterium]
MSEAPYQDNILERLSSVAVIGAGQMGSGIAQVLAERGFSVQLLDQSVELVERSIASVGRRLDRLVEKEVLTGDERNAAMERLQPAQAMSDIKNVDLVIEAIVENVGVKLELLRELDSACKPGTLFASNTSSISITKLAAATGRPENIVGMHFMNPVPVMKLVELIRGLQTSDDTYEVARALTVHLDKTPVTALRDYPG